MFFIIYKVNLFKLIKVIQSVVKTGAAARCGVLAGDRIIVIDGKNVENSSHKDVVQIIKAMKSGSSNKFELLSEAVDPVNPKRDAEAEANGEKIFNIKKINNSYGFSLITNPGSVAGEHEHCIKDIKVDGAAGKAGVENQMLLIAMNGNQCAKMTHSAVVSLVKSGGQNCIMRCKLVVTEVETPAVAKVVAPVAAAAVVAAVVVAVKGRYYIFCKKF